MWRALAFLAFLALAAFGAVWIADRPGVVTITWNGYEVATSLAVALVGVLIAARREGFGPTGDEAVHLLDGAGFRLSPALARALRGD